MHKNGDCMDIDKVCSRNVAFNLYKIVCRVHFAPMMDSFTKSCDIPEFKSTGKVR